MKQNKKGLSDSNFPVKAMGIGAINVGTLFENHGKTIVGSGTVLTAASGVKVRNGDQNARRRRATCEQLKANTVSIPTFAQEFQKSDGDVSLINQEIKHAIRANPKVAETNNPKYNLEQTGNYFVEKPGKFGFTDMFFVVQDKDFVVQNKDLSGPKFTNLGSITSSVYNQPRERLGSITRNAYDQRELFVNQAAPNYHIDENYGPKPLMCSPLGWMVMGGISFGVMAAGTMLFNRILNGVWISPEPDSKKIEEESPLALSDFNALNDFDKKPLNDSLSVLNKNTPIMGKILPDGSILYSFEESNCSNFGKLSVSILVLLEDKPQSIVVKKNISKKYANELVKELKKYHASLFCSATENF